MNEWMNGEDSPVKLKIVWGDTHMTIAIGEVWSMMGIGYDDESSIKYKDHRTHSAYVPWLYSGKVDVIKNKKKGAESDSESSGVSWVELLRVHWEMSLKWLWRLVKCQSVSHD